MLPEVVLQHDAHVLTAWGRCETVQKQQSGIPDRPVFMHKYAVKLQTVATGVVATDTNNKRLKRINFDNFTSKLRVGIKNYELVDNLQGKNM